MWICRFLPQKSKLCIKLPRCFKSTLMCPNWAPSLPHPKYTLHLSSWTLDPFRCLGQKYFRCDASFSLILSNYLYQLSLVTCENENMWSINGYFSPNCQFIFHLFSHSFTCSLAHSLTFPIYPSNTIYQMSVCAQCHAWKWGVASHKNKIIVNWH